MATYLLFQGEYSRRRVVSVTEDVKYTAKMYTDLLKDGEKVDVEIWENNKPIGYFYDYEKVESKVKKAMSMIAIGKHEKSLR
ncbi:hypothetical protein BAOM_3044 [Peribacillus asahii]|uniref:Uncharacterized protein n=1 Tax=Peribacillus asahii TaxID=228899 RepID=A0A3T0KTQ8_9BACI|nr:hypothetical protein [Peribacillus asahii]AZV43653.1 hypothetical protein BAOM_3044 [Peribacillus asahii]